MKIKVIFIPYCNFATSGLSLLRGRKHPFIAREGGDVHESKHPSADRERERHDEQHEESHLCDEQQEDLCAIVLAGYRNGCSI